MNHLAHLFLSRDDDELVLVGNFIADFLTRRESLRMPDAVREGIARHQAIDAFTDSHPLVRQGARRLYAAHSKYAPVIIDVFYDHLLAGNWDRYHERGLAEFARDTYRILERHLDLMPEGLRLRLPLMIGDNWLVKYGYLSGIAFTFDRMKYRAMRPELLNGVMDSLQQDYAELEKEFNVFFPEMIAHMSARSFREKEPLPEKKAEEE